MAAVSGSLIGVLFVALFAYLDWLTHRSLPVAVGGAAVAMTLILARGWIGRRLLQVPAVAQLPPVARRLLLALVPLLYFMVRGAGTSGAGALVLILSMLVAGGLALAAPSLDGTLRGFYAARNRALPAWLRAVLVPVGAILISFLVVHGSLLDLPALFGGQTNSPASPAGREGRFALAIILSGVLGMLLLREEEPS